MPFKRYDGFVRVYPQEKINADLSVCPFCGQAPHWLVNLQSEFSKIEVTYMCENCKGKLYNENNSAGYDDNFQVVDTGFVNKHNLISNDVYHITKLQSIANNGNNQSVEIGLSKSLGGSNYYSKVAAEQTRQNTVKKLITVVGINLILLVVFIMLIFMPLLIKPKPKDLEPIQKSTMYVEEIGGTYFVTIEGVAKNTSKSTMDYVSITFTFYDGSGNVVGNAVTNQVNLGAGQTWAYSATGVSITNRPVTWESTDVTVICY